MKPRLAPFQARHLPLFAVTHSAWGDVTLQHADETDEALILACRRGDAAAWERLVTRYQRAIYSIPRRAGLDEDAAADVFQHAFAMLLEHLARIEHPARVGSWLMITARRETWRLARQTNPSRVRRDDEGGALADTLPDGDPLPDETLVQLEEQHRVRLALATLDERCRRMLTLLFYRDDPPSYAEIAAMFGTSEGSIGPTRARCLEKLRRELERARK